MTVSPGRARGPWLLAALLALGACDNGAVSLGTDEVTLADGPGGDADAGVQGNGSAGSGAMAGDAAAGMDPSGVADAGSARPDSGDRTSDGTSDAIGCGDTTCGGGAICCSASCGLCTAADACRDIACEVPAPAGDCTAAECGDPPSGGAAARCDDGSLRASACLRGGDGRCTWQATDCAPTFAPSSVSCGSRGLDPCADGQFCSFPASASCGETDLPGTCMEIPASCIRLLDPVCGCDGHTYANECVAHSQGVSVRVAGSCDDPTHRCGGVAGDACPDGQYCDLAQGDGCGVADAQGVCATTPDACDDVLDPVCGCDAVSYDNACEAARAGISVATTGACAAGGDMCGGFAGFACPEGQYCDYAQGDGCDIADGLGVCAPRPQACTLQYDPVCGCDGQTYGNACSAASAGVSVRSQGECP